jgi:hypothetical protein
MWEVPMEGSHNTYNLPNIFTQNLIVADEASQLVLTLVFLCDLKDISPSAQLLVESEVL